MPWRHVSALETWYMLCGHGLCSMDMSSCWRRIYGYGRCLLVGEEYILIIVLVLLLKTFVVCPPACRRRLFFVKKDIF